MFFLGSPNIQKMAAERDYDGLVKCLEHRSSVVRLEAAEALAELNDGRGWRYLLDAVRHPESADSQAAAAEILGALGHDRALPVLKEALPSARGPAREAIEEALRSLGAAEPGPERRRIMPDAQEREEPLEAESIFTSLFGGLQGEAPLSDMAPPVLPSTEIEILTPQQHLDNAVQLRENELQERALVECMLALWLKPDWAYAWYLRGVLLEDLERECEALLAYRRALALDSTLREAIEARRDLEDSLGPLPQDPATLLKAIAGGNWRERRDACALLGEWLAGRNRQAGGETEGAVEILLECLSDPEREVRHAAIEALGRSGSRQAVDFLEAQSESSWLLRITLLQALSDLAAVGALMTRLHREMSGFQERNPVFASQKDPLLELEYNLMLEAGVLALERTGDLEGLLQLAEENIWVEDEADALDEDDSTDEDEDLEDVELAEDLLSYADEPAQMAALALERLALKTMPSLSRAVLERLAAVPDLTLLDLEDEQDEPVILFDFSELRTQARKALNL